MSARLAPLGADLLIEAISHIENGTIKREKQNSDEATLAPILKKEDGCIDWSRSATEIYNRLRGFDPWPGAYTNFRGQRLAITRAALSEATLAPGKLHYEKRRLFAGCGNRTALELLEVQPAGKKRMNTEDFLNGYKVLQDERLGELN